jgi:hypothetical protein
MPSTCPTHLCCPADLRTRLASVQAIATDIRTAKTNNVKALINSLVTEVCVRC